MLGIIVYTTTTGLILFCFYIYLLIEFMCPHMSMWTHLPQCTSRSQRQLMELFSSYYVDPENQTQAIRLDTVSKNFYLLSHLASPAHNPNSWYYFFYFLEIDVISHASLCPLCSYDLPDNLILPLPGITELHHHIQFTSCQGSNPGSPINQISTLTTEIYF